MDVTEQAEEQRTAENTGVPGPVLEEPPPAAPDRAAMEPSPAPAAPMPVEHVLPSRAWLRLCYIFEFWIALIAIFTVWSQVGGQGHLDLIAWYIKLTLAVVLAWSAVQMTAAMVENQRAWNRTTARWFAAVLVLSALVAGITYWYHLHEALDEPDTDENSATSVRNHSVDQNFFRVSRGTDRENC